ncbi:MAG: HAMP domain-containing histidine kinase [Aeriscardovia sp.]|nr:HAMP domain-containing histidine kinase [Aeriscardovia sp.]
MAKSHEDQEGGRESSKKAHGNAIPLNLQLIAILFVLLAVGISVVAFATKELIWNYTVNRIDSQLSSQAQLIVNNVEPFSPKSEALPTDYFLQIRNNQGQILSTPLIPVLDGGAESIPKLAPSGEAGDLEFGVPTTVSSQVLEEGNANSSYKEVRADWRVLKLHWYQSGGGQSGILYIGLSLYNAQETAWMVIYYFIIVGIIIILIALIIGSLIISKTLRPLKQIETIAANIANGDLSQRVPALPESTEIGSLASSLNIMLSKIEKSFKAQKETNDQMKQFISDASHELRTPLSAIRAYAELYKMEREEGEDLEKADEIVNRIGASSARMTELVTDLLSLARLDEGRGIDLTQSVELDSLILDSVEDLMVLDPQRKVCMGTLEFLPDFVTSKDAQQAFFSCTRFVAGELPPIATYGDGTRLREVFTNLVGNIHKYTPADCPVEISLSSVQADISYEVCKELASSKEPLQSFCLAMQKSLKGKGGLPYALITVSDHGPGMTPDSIGRIFERFYTFDPSRTRKKSGTGLGMAIVKAIISSHSGFICAEPTPGGGLTIITAIPATGSPLPIAASKGGAEEKGKRQN